MPKDDRPLHRTSSDGPDVTGLFGPAVPSRGRPARLVRDLAAVLLVVSGVAALTAVAWSWHWQAGVCLTAVAVVAAGVLLGIG
jgi:hypothetical protein